MGMPREATSTGAGYADRRAWIANYFDRTASQHWQALTSDAPVSRIRRTVRAGRERMAATLLSWLPESLDGLRVLDAGCGTGVLSLALAHRGAHVVAVDLAGSLLEVARERMALGTGRGRVDLHVGDMLQPALGTFDYVVAMDSLIHYDATELDGCLRTLVGRTRRGILFTFAPRTLPLAVMHAVGRLIPRGGHRAPAIQPIAETVLRRRLRQDAFAAWSPGRTERVSSGFYTSQALELVPSSLTHLAPPSE